MEVLKLKYHFGKLSIKKYLLETPFYLLVYRIETIDGTAESGEDYQKIDEIKTMVPHQRYLPIDVIIVDDNQWEPDETFFVKISMHNDDPILKLGPKGICMITIINDDEPGEVEFKEPVHVVKESVGTFDVLVERKNGADGNVSLKYKTSDINAIAGEDYERTCLLYT
jgi:solute carrier family 8 (sodium/calcium exchanger)